MIKSHSHGTFLVKNTISGLKNRRKRPNKPRSTKTKCDIDDASTESRAVTEIYVRGCRRRRADEEMSRLTMAVKTINPESKIFPMVRSAMCDGIL